jgi:hypothetical protein
MAVEDVMEGVAVLSILRVPSNCDLMRRKRAILTRRGGPKFGSALDRSALDEIQTSE